MDEIRQVFFVSDSTGITVEMLGQSILAQFADVELAPPEILAFVDGEDKAAAAAARINAAAKNGPRPLVFCTIADESIAKKIRAAHCCFTDCLEVFVRPLEKELGRAASRGRAAVRDMSKMRDYQRRMDALQYTMNHDDGAMIKHLDRADVILAGVSRCGKTPTAFYMALHFGVAAANYPLIPEDLEKGELPEVLQPHLARLHGLTIAPARLAKIRAERRPNSRYADPALCASEVRAAEKIFAAAGVPYLDTTRRSVEEISAKITQVFGLSRSAH